MGVLKLRILCVILVFAGNAGISGFPAIPAPDDGPITYHYYNSVNSHTSPEGQIKTTIFFLPPSGSDLVGPNPSFRGNPYNPGPIFVGEDPYNTGPVFAGGNPYNPSPVFMADDPYPSRYPRPQAVDPLISLLFGLQGLGDPSYAQPQPINGYGFDDFAYYDITDTSATSTSSNEASSTTSVYDFDDFSYYLDNPEDGEKPVEVPTPSYDETFAEKKKSPSVNERSTLPGYYFDEFSYILDIPTDRPVESYEPITEEKGYLSAANIAGQEDEEEEYPSAADVTEPDVENTPSKPDLKDAVDDIVPAADEYPNNRLDVETNQNDPLETTMDEVDAYFGSLQASLNNKDLSPVEMATLLEDSQKKYDEYITKMEGYEQKVKSHLKKIKKWAEHSYNSLQSTTNDKQVDENTL